MEREKSIGQIISLKIELILEKELEEKLLEEKPHFSMNLLKTTSKGNLKHTLQQDV